MHTLLIFFQNGLAGLAQLLPIVLIIVIFYVILIRPQQKRQRQLQETIANLKIGDRVVINVVDTGPGTDAAYTVRAEQSTGVGLANIRDRLAQAYGADHRFETQTNIQGGFSVTIEIPYQVQVSEESR